MRFPFKLTLCKSESCRHIEVVLFHKVEVLKRCTTLREMSVKRMQLSAGLLAERPSVK